MQTARRSLAIQYGVVIATTVIVLLPVLPVIGQSLLDREIYRPDAAWTLGNFQIMLGDARFWGALRNSLVLSTLSTVIALAIGATTAILVARTDLPMRRTIGALSMLPFFVSQLLVALGFVILYGPAGYLTGALRQLIGADPWSLYNIFGLSLVAGAAQAPLIMVYCLGALALIDTNLESAARTCGASPLGAFRKATLPMLIPALLSSAMLTFTGSMEMLAVPLILGAPAKIEFLTSYVYSMAFGSAGRNQGIVGAAAVVLLLIVFVTVYLQYRLMRVARRFTSVTGKAARARVLELGRWKWPVFALVAAYTLLLVVGPMLALVLRSFVSILSPMIPIGQVLTLDHYTQILTLPEHWRSMVNTVIVAGIGGLMATVFAALIALVVHRSDNRMRRALDYVSMVPRGIPGMVSGLGFLYALMFLPGSSLLAGTLALIMLAYASRHLPAAIGAITPALAQVSPDLEKSARVIGADWWGSVRVALVPLMRPAMLAGFALIFSLFAKEYATALFLVVPGTELLGVSILRTWSQGEAGVTAALSTVQMVIVALALLVSRRFIGGTNHG